MNSEPTIKRFYRLLILSFMLLSLSLYMGCEKDDDPVTCNTVDEAGELVKPPLQCLSLQPRLHLFLSYMAHPLFSP
jgi:hypothetical protein